MSENTSITFPALRNQIVRLALGPQTWFNKRMRQVLAFALREFERIESDGPADCEYFDRLCVMNAEALLVVNRHIERMNTPKLRQENIHTTRLLRTVSEILDHGYDTLVVQFGVPGLLEATDKFALAKAIYFHLEGITVAEADADANELRKLYAEAEAEKSAA